MDAADQLPCMSRPCPIPAAKNCMLQRHMTGRHTGCKLLAWVSVRWAGQMVGCSVKEWDGHINGAAVVQLVHRRTAICGCQVHAACWGPRQNTNNTIKQLETGPQPFFQRVGLDADPVCFRKSRGCLLKGHACLCWPLSCDYFVRNVGLCHLVEPGCIRSLYDDSRH